MLNLFEMQQFLNDFSCTLKIICYDLRWVLLRERCASIGVNAECLHWMKSLQMPTLFEEHSSSIDSSLVLEHHDAVAQISMFPSKSETT